MQSSDDRAGAKALLPFLAYQAIGESFKWLFCGDDDTVVFIDGLFQLAAQLDHNIPYVISGKFCIQN